MYYYNNWFPINKSNKKTVELFSTIYDISELEVVMLNNLLLVCLNNNIIPNSTSILISKSYFSYCKVDMFRDSLVCNILNFQSLDNILYNILYPSQDIIYIDIKMPKITIYYKNSRMIKVHLQNLYTIHFSIINKYLVTKEILAIVTPVNNMRSDLYIFIDHINFKFNTQRLHYKSNLCTQAYFDYIKTCNIFYNMNINVS